MSSWYTPPAFVPVQYIPANQKDYIRGLQVLEFSADAHRVSSGAKTNHWALYLAIGNGQSVRIDVQPNPQRAATTIQGGSKANLLISLLRYPKSNSVNHSEDIGVAPGLLVGHVVDYLVQSGRDRYDFTPEGVGCRKWTTDTLALFGEAGWLDKDAVERAKSAIAKFWPDGTPLPLDNGQYY